MYYIVRSLRHIIREERIERGIQISAIACDLGVPLETVQQWEKDEYQHCTLAQVEAILKSVELPEPPPRHKFSTKNSLGTVKGIFSPTTTTQ
jgi:ribosome-binding protein aMBF1 (putative translation factor)